MLFRGGYGCAVKGAFYIIAVVVIVELRLKSDSICPSEYRRAAACVTSQPLILLWNIFESLGEALSPGLLSY